MINLDHKMPNGASAADWLGTARGHAIIAAATIEDIRRSFATDLDDAEGRLIEALYELRKVKEFATC